MQIDAQHQEKLNSITHSPYYGCTIRVFSKAQVSYEGVLDGISINKDRIYLKNVRVNADLSSYPHRNKLTDENNLHEKLNAVMIDHLTNDVFTYDQVCLNVRDIQELKLIEFPSTFNESKEKLRSIDPCLVDIRLSPSDQYKNESSRSITDIISYAPITHKKRTESFGSAGTNPLISSSSNESSSSFGLHSNDKFTDESNDESVDEQIEKFRQLMTVNSNTKPVTLLAKKVLPKKIERRTDGQSINPNNNHFRQTISDNHQTVSNTLKKDLDRKSSPIRVTITSRLNPNATPFYSQQRQTNPSLTFYRRPRFRPGLQPVVSPDHSQSEQRRINSINNNNSQQQDYRRSHQRFVPPRQMELNKNFFQTKSTRTNTRSNQTPPPIMKYRIHSSSTPLDKQSFPQQQQQQNNQKLSNNFQYTELSRQTSLPITARSDYFNSRNNSARQSITSNHSSISLPYHSRNSNDFNQIQRKISIQEPIGSHRSQRTVSGTSSCSSINMDIGPHSIVQLDSTPTALISFEEQYDFEKANQEFRRYLELEELVSRRSSSNCGTGSNHIDNSTEKHQHLSQTNSYKKEISFFDHISCTATTGTAVGYTEMDETEKNLETFGQDALLMSSNSNDNEWQI